MTDWKNDLKILADKLRTEQKNKKGAQYKFDQVRGYKNKKVLTIQVSRSPQKQPKAYAKIKPDIKADMRVQHCSKSMKKEQPLQGKDGNI